MKSIKTIFIFLFSSILFSCGHQTATKNEDKLAASAEVNEGKPNVVLIFLDDAGYSDFQPFEGAENVTPNISRLADEGTLYTNFHLPQAICSASRSALLTGCFPGRTKVFGAHAPRQKGLDPSFATLAEQLKKGGYKTGFYGKWHLGDMPETRPQVRGFDESAGIMYSADMWKYHPGNPEYWGKYPLAYWENGEVTIEEADSADQELFTKWSTDYSVEFIEKHKKEPFFLYLAYNQPHVPLFVSEEFKGKSGKGLYGDVIMELDYSIGRVMDKLKEVGVEKNTIVIFSSDNGPWAVYGNHAGKTIFKEEKGTSFDGGIRSPLIIKYPGNIKAGVVSNNFLHSIDVAPTICKLTGSPLPDHEIDGEDAFDRWTGQKTGDYNRKYHAFSTGKQFEGLFSSDGRWKLHLKHNYRWVKEYGSDGWPGKYIQKKIKISLFDMENDRMETTDVKDQHPEIFEQLKTLAEQHRERFYGDL